jgi:hypothetical protein
MTVKPLERVALVLACGVLVGLTACSSRVRALVQATQAAHSVSATAHPAASPTADMVSAVVLGKTSVPVDVKFALRQRPEVGQSATLDLLIIPSAPLDRVTTSFHAEGGLTLRDGAAPSVQERPEPGVPISHSLTIVAQQDGIFYVDATVLAESGTESIGRTFTIPVIAGAGTQ